MRQGKILLLLLFVLAGFFQISANVKPKSLDSATGIFYLMTKDGHEDFTVDGSVVFKATSSTTIPTYKDNGVTFSPKNPGEIIVATVNEVDLGGANYLLSYDGYVKTGESGLSDGKDQSTYLPAGWTNKIIAGKEGLVITSASTDGKLTFGFHSSSAAGQKGFTISVQSVVPKDMELLSASAMVPSTSLFRGAKSQIVGGANIKTEGLNNALTLNEITFDLSSLSANQVSNLRVYNGTIEPSNLVTISGDIGNRVTCNIESSLKSGDNKFLVVCDLAPDFIGALPSINLSGVKIDGLSKVVTSPSTEIVNVENTILMPAENVVYNIGDPVNFYDDGGINGTISLNFNGSVTFVPTTPGEKIKIDFSKLAIFNTSTVGKNDIFKFYNGRTADEANLIETLLTDAKIVKSTAEDGSLTVTLSSTTGVAAAGWEAVVSQFLPGNMTFNSASSEISSAETLSASSANQQFITLNIKADNILQPLVLTKVILDATGTSKLASIGKVKVYSLGDKNQFSTANLVGETIPSSNSFEITGNTEIKEGSNYFAIVADVAANASNDELISIKAESFDLGDTNHQLADAQTAVRKVNNVFKHKAGQNTVTIYDNWVFTDTKSTLYPTKYEYDNADCIVTFIPAETGKMVQIDFDKFDVYYATSSYGVKATYEIYSGSEVNKTNLLWALTDASQATTGPGKIIRSNSADGALTVKFNANTTYSSYAGTGWNATITPFQDHAMTIESIDVKQTSVGVLAPGSTNQGIINFGITTEGSLTPQEVKEITIDIKESAPALAKVIVLYSGESNDVANAVEFGSANYTEGSEIKISGNQALPEGMNNFWVVYDMKNSIPSDINVDARLISVITNDAEAHVPANGDPDGVRLTKNLLNLKKGDNGEIVLNDALLFYDDGGADAKYSLNFDGQVTFVPSSSDKIVKLKFNSFRTNTSHYLYIYDGKNVDEAKLVGKYSSTTFPAELISHSEDGALTVRFISSSSGTTYNGWEISAESYTPLALSVDKIETSFVGDANIMRGSEDEETMKIAITVSGDKGTLNIGNIKGDFQGTTSVSDIKNIKLWYSGSADGFNKETLIGESATTSSFDFNPNVSINKAGTYYFWISTSVQNEAVAGNKIAYQVSEILVDNTPVSEITASSNVETSVKAGMKGEFTIGNSETANYSSFAQAVQALSGGVEGAVTFKVEAGKYAENIKISNIKGTTSAHNILFTSASGKNDDVIVSGSGYSEPAYGEQKYGMVAVENTDYVTFDNLSFVPTSQSYPMCIHVLNHSCHFTLSNSIVKADPITDGYTGMNLFQMEAKNIEGKNNDYVTVDNNTFSGGYIALYMGGTGYVALTKEKGAIIRNNTIKDARSKSVYLFDENGALIEGNTIICDNSTKTDYNGMDIYRNIGNTIIRNNKIINNQNVYSSGIYLRQETRGSVDAPILIYNNSVALTSSPSTSSNGINISGDCSNIVVSNNSVNINGTAGYAFTIGGTYTTAKNITVQNNLFQNNTVSPVINIAKADVLPQIAFKNNAYFTTGTKFASNGGDLFSDWQTNNNDNASIIEKADFLSNGDLHLKSAGNLNMAIPVSYISTDLEGTTRSTTTPTLGAFEYQNIVIEKPEIAQDYPQNGTITYQSIEIKTKWNQAGKLHSIIKLSTEEAPTSAELLAISGSDILKNTENTTTFANLAEKTAYKAYFLLEGSLGENSDIIATNEVSTLKYIAPLKLSFDKVDAIDTNTSITITPKVSGGEEPYTYSWINRMNENVGTTATITLTPELSEELSLTVKSADGQKVSSFVQIPVYGKKAIASFEDNALDADSYWKGKTPGIDEIISESVFYSGSYSFTNTHMPSYATWGGFSYSNVTATDFDPDYFVTQQFRNVVGKGAKNTSTYSVAYPMSFNTTINVLSSRDGETISGVYLTNSAYTYNYITVGDSFGSSFTTGDYHKVVFTGDDPEGQKVEFYLADYRDSDPTKHYVVTDWKWCDLQPLGKVKTIKVSIQSSNSYVPAYVCLDELGSSVSGVDNVNNNSVSIYPVPAVSTLNINGIEGSYSARIHGLDGRAYRDVQNLNNEAKIDVESLSSGTYILEIRTQDGSRIVKTFIKQ